MQGRIPAERRWSRVCAVLIATLVVSLCPLVAHAAPWVAHHGMTSAEYQANFNYYSSIGYRLRLVSGYEVGSAERYAAIWDQSPGAPYSAAHGLTSAQYQAYFDARVAEGYRLVHVSAYDVAGVDLYAAIFELRGGPAWQARHRLTSAEYQQTFDDLVSQGYRLVDVSGYEWGGEARYAAIWEQAAGPAWQARHGLTSSEYQAAFDDLVSQGYRLTDVSGYRVGGQDRYAAIWELKGGAAWQARHALTSAQYQATFDDLVGQGYDLVSVSGYDVGGTDYYAAIWEVPVAEGDYPITGTLLPGLEAFDDAMLEYMVPRGITSGTLAITKDGNLVLERGYGWQDQAKSIPMEPDALLRLASVVKPFTSAAIKTLIAEGTLSSNDRVFCVEGSPANCVLDIVPFGTPDSRTADITIQHLLDHQGGFDRDVSGDPMFMPFDIADALGIPSPPEPLDIASYMLGQPLDFTPGDGYAYSNYGYMLLGLVVEEMTGVATTTFFQEEIFAPFGVPASEIELGRTLPFLRNPREPWYDDPYYGYNVFDRTELVPWPDGGFYIEAMEAHGGLIASAQAVARFMDNYLISGDPNPGGTGASYTFFGSLPGTWTMARQRPDGVNIAALFNKRGNTEDEILYLMDAVADGIVWPVPGSCHVSYIAYDWPTGSTVNVVVTNTHPTEDINGWTLQWEFGAGQQITNFWSGVYTQAGSAVSVENMPWNSYLAQDGGQAWLGFNLSHSGSNPIPTSISLNGTPCTVN